MSGTPVSPHGFAAVRGRGYRPGRVDAYVDALCRDRDATWERAACLTVLARDMEAQAEGLRETVASLVPQTYEELGERARRVFELAEEEAAAVRERARRDARECVAQAEAHALGVRRAAREEADALRADAEEHAGRRLQETRAEADGIRVAARREVKAGRSESLTALRGTRQRTSGMLADTEREHAARWADAERADAERAAALDARHARRVTHAEEALSEAEAALAEAKESARRRQEEARAHAAELLAQARLREDRIVRETECLLREHGELWDDVQAHMDRMRSSLSALTARAAE
ncbi:cellulose-binding protein [Streptomyces sp. MUM 2J]|uniref:cellulose-binding protein n=1 Tax=Streptomyces sp. MUM 2J TaxID=2791987 RepID=UPI001F03CA78|nr:cellulose-binding protein [Streptomyces sp. MUM 2J]MCH0564313.1 cellulose-binding protein [Streptomyces sp. MUM 2J]